MNPLDELIAREAIKVVMARYTMAGDRLHEDDFISVFTSDAVLETEGVAIVDAFRHEGRAAIKAWIGRWREVRTPHKARFVRHHLSTSLIEFKGPGAAKARTYWTAMTDIGPDHGGVYLDDFRQEAGAWLIARRRIREDWRSPDSLFSGAVERTR
jgi:hypothetical protein